jgi:hypothetical protein
MKRIYSFDHPCAKMFGNLALSMMLAAASSVGATTWYVSTTGNDSNPGTSNAPFQHVQFAVTNAVYGDTVNIQAGVYREQVVAYSTAGVGSVTNMLTIQAWDTNGDGIIETNEMPTINAFQLITNWTALTNGSIWTNLTGALPFQPNAIFWTPWAPNSTNLLPFTMVAESETNVLLPTSWPFICSCDAPTYMPTNMTQGSFQYDYTNRIMYVWRSDGNIPGPEYPIQAADLNTNLPSWGGGGPIGIYSDFVHARYLRLRYSDDALSCGGSPYGGVAIGISLGYYSIIEGCDVQWMAYQGGQALASLVTNCVFANNGELGLGILGTNVIVTGCTFSNNDLMHYSEGCGNEGAIHVQSGSASFGGTNLVGTIISNNVFINNWEDAIHLDTTGGTQSNL